MMRFGFHVHAALAVLTAIACSAQLRADESVRVYCNLRGAGWSGATTSQVTRTTALLSDTAMFRKVDFGATPPAGHLVSNWFWSASGATTGRDSDPMEPIAGKSFAKVSADRLTCTLSYPTGSASPALGVYFDYVPLTVTFDGNGGTAARAMSPIDGKNYDSSFALTSNAYVKTGYKFANWTNDLGKTFADKAPVTGSSFWDDSSRQFHAALSAAWTPNAYKVTFDKNGGNDPTPSSKTVTYGSTYGDLASCTRTGYTFDGWYTAASGGTKVATTTKVAITAAQKLYAHWTPNTYAVTFDANAEGVPPPASKTVTYDSTYGTLPSPARTGYTLSGWYTAASGGTKVEATTKVTITAAQKLYAHWTTVSYTISYSGLKSGATHGNPTAYTVESDTITFAAPSAAVGYKFVGWEPTSIEKGSTGNKTVTAKYLTCIEKPTPSVYELSYNGGLRTIAPGGNMSATGHQATDPGEYTATFTPNAGYCWTDGTTDQYSFTWKIVKAEITGASVQQTAPLTYTGEAQQPVVLLSAVVKGGKTMVWEFSKDGAAFSSAVPSFVDAGTYTAFFKVSAENHESAFGRFTVTVDRSPTAEVTLDRTTFVYTGKAQGPTATFLHCSESATSENRKTEVGTYHVRATPDPNYSWKQNPKVTYELSFKWEIVERSYVAQIRPGEGGSGDSSLRYTAGATNQTFEIELPTRSGHHIAAWTADGWEGDAAPSVDGNVLTIAAGTTGAFTLTPTWERNAFYVRYDRNGATNETEMAVQEFLFDVEQELAPNEYARTGYGFLGWATNASDSAVYADRAVVSNLTDKAGVTNVLYATWSTNRYTVTFRRNGGIGTAPEDMSFAYGEKRALNANTLEAPEHLRFAGWGLDPSQTAPSYTNGQEVVNLAEEDGATVKLYAIWGDAFERSPESEALECENLQFRNRLSEAWTVVKNSPSEGDVCLYHKSSTKAELSADTGGCGGKLTFCWIGEDLGRGKSTKLIILVDEQTVGTYDFKGKIGWQTNTISISHQSGQSINFAHEQENTACWLDWVKWEPDAFTLRYDANGGYGAPVDALVPTGAAVRVSTVVPEKENCDFLGWSRSDGGDVVCQPGDEVTFESATVGDVVRLYAVWEAAPGEGVYTVRFKVPEGWTVPAEMENCKTGMVYKLPDLPSPYLWRRLDASGGLYDGGVLIFNLTDRAWLEMEAVRAE